MQPRRFNISLPADLARFIEDEVRAGHYASASDVVSDGLRRMRGSANGNGREFDRAEVAKALDGLRRLAATQTLGSDLTLRDLIDEGRA
jgi:putative addiction module CopG family antidote